MSFVLLAVILATVTLSAFAQLALKMGVGAISPAVQAKGVGLELLAAAASSPLILLGLAIYGVSVVAWLWVLSKTDLSVAYPFVGLSFLTTMFFGSWFLHENVTPLRLAGTLLVVVGCIIVARSA